MSTVLLAALWVPTPAAACPGAIFTVDLFPRLKGPRKGTRLFVKDASGLRAIPIQIDPIDGDGHLIFYDDDHFHAKEISKNDLITFRVEEFGSRLVPGKDKLPCTTGLVYEVVDPASGRYAYLTNCGFQTHVVDYPQLVKFDKAGHVLESEIYRYRFNPDNYMQFDTIDFASPAGGWEQVAADSKLLIRADVKKFFTMTFDSKEIESQLEASRLGPIGNLARVSFFLRILFFKIRMSLATDVAFFRDAGHIPMMVSIPVNAYDYLKPKSGILYSWALTPAAKNARPTVDMPMLDTSLVAKGYEELGKSAGRFCVGEICRFKYGAEIGERRMAMDLDVNKKLVERGFFPQFVGDVSAFKEEMGWKIDIPKDQHRLGMYFEVSGLPEGGHPWDFWMRLGSKQTSSRICPAPVNFKKWKA